MTQTIAQTPTSQTPSTKPLSVEVSNADMEQIAKKAASLPPVQPGSSDSFGSTEKSNLASFTTAANSSSVGGGISAVGNVIHQMKSSGEAINPGEANCGYTVAEILKRATGDSMGIDPYVPTAIANMRANGKWQEISVNNYTPKSGDVGISRVDGHIGISDGQQFYAANESGRKTIDVSHYQPDKGNVNAIFRLTQNAATIAPPIA
ncbi:MAG: hypothetical protein SFU25_02570 [Candidatus Caenarcaniphilales bacterium]|nr:hypothetical protein [Candidatus Caenarcaniphilales bacterium]